MRKDANGRVYVVTDPKSPLATAVLGLGIPVHNAIELSYSGGAVSGVTYFQDAAVVATLTLSYDIDGNLIRVERA